MLKIPSILKKIKSPKTRKQKLRQKRILTTGETETIVETIQNNKLPKINIGCVVVEPDQKFQLLFSFLEKRQHETFIVYVGSQESLDFHVLLLNNFKINCKAISDNHSKANILFTCEYKSLKDRISNWVILYDAPKDIQNYVEFVDTNKQSKHLLWVLSHEKNTLEKYLGQLNAKLQFYSFPSNKLGLIQSELQKLVEKNFNINRFSFNAYRGFLLNYQQHPLQDVFDINQVNVELVAKSFGFVVPPRLELKLNVNKDLFPETNWKQNWKNSFK